MKYLLLLTFVLFSSSSANQSQLLKEFSLGYDVFTANVYKELLTSNSGNFIVCPLSADIILALTNSGAQGQTAKQLATALHLPEDPVKVHDTFKAISPSLQSSNEYTLSSANKVYIKNGFKISNHFKDVAVNVFNAEIQNINFSRKRAAANEINRWVEDKTHNKIKDLISSDMLSRNTRTVLVNAIYFHGNWEVAFNTHSTIKSPFHVNRRNHIETDMMTRIDHYDYYESSELNAKFLKLDYEGGDVSMHIVLPNEKEGLADLEEKISNALEPPSYNYEKVSIMLPKFKIESQIEFKPILQKLGVKNAFEDNAVFGGFGGEDESLKFSEIVQKAFIEVEEKGTTAAAATGVHIVALSLPRPESPPKLFHADHPFLFYLRLNRLGINFFVGRYKSP